jgi:hypothetical protein
MSTFLYGILTTRCETSPRGTSNRSHPPGVNAFVDALAAPFPLAFVGVCAAKRRSPPARAARHAQLKAEVRRVHAENFGVYGAREVWRQLAARGSPWPAARWSGLRFDEANPTRRSITGRGY